MSPRLRPFPIVALALLLGACDIADGRSSLATRETLANGAVMVTYSALPELPIDSLVPDLRIGKVDGEEWETFGSIRALEVGPDGTFYVLDSQAAEVRAFDATGAYRATLAREGQGPGEIRRQANGMTLGGDGTLWVNDPSARAIVGLAAEGREVGRHPTLVTGFGSEWDGVMDQNGVIRQTWAYRIASDSPPRSGLIEDRRNVYVKVFDTRSLAYDSTYVGVQVSRVLRIVDESPGSVSVAQIAVPHDARRLSVIDRSGNLWTASSDSYRITRMAATGDTTLILDVALQGPMLSAEDHASADEMFGRLEMGVSPELPERKPVLARLITDDEGRLWVRRTSATDEELTQFDVFGADGELLGHVRLPAGISPTPPPVIRGGHLYAVLRDELDVSYVIRAPLPAFARPDAR